MLYYIKPHNEYICSISVDSDFDFGNGWSLMGETSTHFYMSNDNINKAYAVAKALGVSITTVNTAWEIDPCLLEYDTMYLDTLSWTVEYWDNLPVEMINAIIATGDEYGFDLYTKAYAYMRNGIAVYNNPDIDWDAPAPELPDAIEPVRDDIVPELVDDDLQLFANHYSLIVWSCITKNHNFDVLDSEDEYANKYEETILHEYYQDDKPYRAKDFHEFCISCPEANDIINKYIGVNILWQMGHTDEYVIEIASYFFENYDIPSEKEAYHKYAPHLIPVRDDVKLLPPVEVIPEPVEVIVPQEVISEPQEDCLSTTTEDNVMNTSTFIPSWEVSGYISILELNFGTYVPVVEPVVELTGQYSEFACHISDGWTGQSSDVLEGWTGQCSELTCHISDGWYGQCCDLADAPKPVEQLSDAQYRVQQACAKMARRSAYASPVRCGSLVVNTPTITTKSGDIVKVSDEEFAELESMFDKAMAKPKFPFTIVNNNSLQGNQINPDCSRAKAIIGYGQVSKFKSTLFNVDEYDITRNVVVDVATTTPKATPATPKAPATPKPSTAKFANNFNSLVMAKYRELNGGIIKDSLVLNKLTSALRANNSEAYTALVTTFGNPTAVALHQKAYDAVVSAS